MATGKRGKDLLGCDIEIWWPGDECFYKGRVEKFQEGSNLHRVVYSDGDVEILDLNQEHWRFVDEFSVAHDEEQMKYAVEFKSDNGLVARSHPKSPNSRKKGHYTSYPAPGRNIPVCRSLKALPITREGLASFSDRKIKSRVLSDGDEYPHEDEFPHWGASRDMLWTNFEPSTQPPILATQSYAEQVSDHSGEVPREKRTRMTRARMKSAKDRAGKRLKGLTRKATRSKSSGMSSSSTTDIEMDNALAPFEAVGVGTLPQEAPTVSKRYVAEVTSGARGAEEGRGTLKADGGNDVLERSKMEYSQDDPYNLRSDSENEFRNTVKSMIPRVNSSAPFIGKPRTASLNNGLHADRGGSNSSEILSSGMNEAQSELKHLTEGTRRTQSTVREKKSTLTPPRRTRVGDRGVNGTIEAKGKIKARESRSRRAKASSISDGTEFATRNSTRPQDHGARRFSEERLLTRAKVNEGDVQKRPRSETLNYPNKRRRSEETVDKLGNRRDNQFVMTKDARSAAAPGISPFHVQTNSEDGDSTGEPQNRIPSHPRRPSVDNIMSIMNEHFRRVARELKESREIVRRRFDALRRDSESIRKELDTLKRAHDELKEAHEVRTNVFLKRISEKVSSAIGYPLADEASARSLDRRTTIISPIQGLRQREIGIVQPKRHSFRPSDVFGRRSALLTPDEPIQPNQRTDVRSGNYTDDELQGKPCDLRQGDRLNEDTTKNSGLMEVESWKNSDQRRSVQQSAGLQTLSSSVPGHASVPQLRRNGLDVLEGMDGFVDEHEVNFVRTKNHAKAIVARAATIWLLETDHPCMFADHVLWAQKTSAECLTAVANENLLRFVDAEQALSVLSFSLGNTVELDWFAYRATPHNLSLARRNYDAWDPPPTDYEWAIEELLLREISERYFLADCAYSTHDAKNKSTLEVAMEICLHAGSSEIYRVIKDNPLTPRKNKWYICKKLGTSDLYAKLKCPPSSGWAVCRVEEGFSDSNGLRVEEDGILRTGSAADRNQPLSNQAQPAGAMTSGNKAHP